MIKKRLIQVGVGGWGWTWLDIVRCSKEWEPVAYVDSKEENLEKAAEAYGMKSSNCFSSIEEAFESIHADAVLIVVPPHTHAGIAMRALESGLHVLVEKPLADTMKNAMDMVEKAEKESRKLMVSQNYRFKRAPRTVKKILESGILGEVGYVNINFHKAPHFIQPDIPYGYKHYKFIEDMTIHHFDLLMYLLGSDPQTVYATSWNPNWSWFASEPCTTAIIEFENGVFVTYCGSWVSQGLETTWDGDWRIECTKGELHWAQNRVAIKPKEIVYIKDMFERAGRLEVSMLPMDLEDRGYSLYEFYKAIEEDRKPEVDARDNLKTLALTFGIRMASEKNKKIDLRGLLL